jgi:hypothetical protein
MNVKIITNGKGLGDWVIIVVDGEEIFSGHNIGTIHLMDIMQTINGFEFISYHDLTDEEIENWQDVVYK